MIQKHCFECGTALIEKELEEEGIVPYCPKCQQYRFPMYNVAVSMIVVDATIRTFVMKFHEMGLLTARKAGNRVFYHVGGTSDGRPLRAKCSLSDLLR